MQTTAGFIRWVKFLIIDKPLIYNVILGTPWIHSMKAIPSSYHQCIKFPNKDGIYSLREDQKVARDCFIKEKKLRGRTFAISDQATKREISELPLPEKPSLAAIEQIDQSKPERCVGIRADLEDEVKKQMIELLETNVATFVWSTNNMPMIDPEIASHKLNVNLSYKPIKQKIRKLGPERVKAVNDEVKRLIEAGSIIEVKYPEWLANPVCVKKKNGKWRVCLDFTDLNKACLKDSFPLPHIDRLV